MNKKPIIEKIVVVEGKSDTERLKKFFDVDTIETRGLANSKDILNKIIFAHKKRGIIIFTDPDFPGEKIRKRIANELENCDHIYLKKLDAKGKNGRIGVEYASESSLIDAFKNIRSAGFNNEEIISKRRLLEEGLISGKNSKYKREKIGNILKIGYTNGKQLYYNLKSFGITLEEFKEAIAVIKNEFD